MLSQEMVLSTLTAHLPELQNRFCLKKIGIFGSFAQNTQTGQSDIDFIVEFADDVPDLFEVKYQLRTYLQALFHREVDIANARFIKPYVIESIKRSVKYAG